MARSAEDRSLHARVAAHSKWAQVDAVAGTARARKAALDRFDRIVDPDGQLDPSERARRAEQAKKAYFLSLARKSAMVRKKDDS